VVESGAVEAESILQGILVETGFTDVNFRACVTSFIKGTAFDALMLVSWVVSWGTSIANEGSFLHMAQSTTLLVVGARLASLFIQNGSIHTFQTPSKGALLTIGKDFIAAAAEMGGGIEDECVGSARSTGLLGGAEGTSFNDFSAG
jgi:hypothetical protein